MARLQTGQRIIGEFEVVKVLSPYEIQLSNDQLGDGYNLKFEQPHAFEEGDVLKGEIRVESLMQ